MKTIVLAIVIACCALGASAQKNTPDLLSNDVKGLKLTPLKLDTTLAKLTMPKQYTLLDMPFAALPPTDLTFAATGNIVYSRMPVARLHSTDHMPVAKTKATGDGAGVLRITVVDPLKGAGSK